MLLVAIFAARRIQNFRFIMDITLQNFTTEGNFVFQSDYRLSILGVAHAMKFGTQG